MSERGVANCQHQRWNYNWKRVSCRCWQRGNQGEFRDGSSPTIGIKFFINDYLFVCRMFRHSQSLPETRLGLFEEYIRMALTCEELGTGPGERFPYAQLKTGQKDGGKTWL